MAHPERFPALLHRVITVYTVVLVAFPLVASLAWAGGTRDMITLNLPHDGVVVAMQLLYCLGLFFSYPIQLFPAVQILESWAPLSCRLLAPTKRDGVVDAAAAAAAGSAAAGKEKEGGYQVEADSSRVSPAPADVVADGSSSKDEEATAAVEPAAAAAVAAAVASLEMPLPPRSACCGVLFRSAIVGFTALVAAAVPKFGLFVNLIGAATGAMIAFILPALCHLWLYPEQSRGSRCVAWSIVGVGVVGGGLSATISMIELWRAFGGDGW
jgi:hypothetical protein